MKQEQSSRSSQNNDDNGFPVQLQFLLGVLILGIVFIAAKLFGLF